MSQSDQERLQRLLSYNPKTGSFYWKDSGPRRKQLVNHLAGSLTRDGYRMIHVCGFSYKAEDLAWLFCYGEWPKTTLRHLNHQHSDNRIENLAESVLPRPTARYKIAAQRWPLR